MQSKGMQNVHGGTPTCNCSECRPNSILTVLSAHRVCVLWNSSLFWSGFGTKYSVIDRKFSAFALPWVSPYFDHPAPDLLAAAKSHCLLQNCQMMCHSFPFPFFCSVRLNTKARLKLCWNSVSCVGCLDVYWPVQRGASDTLWTYLLIGCLVCTLYQSPVLYFRTYA